MSVLPETLFVYGTLRTDVPARFKRAEARLATLVLEENGALIGPGSMAGEMYDAHRSYPCMVLKAGAFRVRGQLWRLLDPAAIIGPINAYEGSMYDLAMTDIRLDTGETVSAHTYGWTASIAGLKQIPSGDYLQWLTEQEASPGS